MPSEHTRRQFANWFRKTYPQEFYYFHKLESNLAKLYSHDYLALNEDEFAEISLNIRKLQGDKYHLVANPYAAIFLGSLCKTIMEEFASNLESFISTKVQDEFEKKLSTKCSKCENMNLSGSGFCNLCGIRLDPANKIGNRNNKNT